MDLVDASMSSPTTTKDDELEAVELFDDYWFFHNLLQKKNRMFRSCSDPYPSSNNNMEEVFEQIKKSESAASNNQPKENGLARQNLLRTPSLPLTIGREKGVTDKDKEVSHKSTKLTWQASLSSSTVLPPLRASKNTTSSPGIPKRQARREPVIESTTRCKPKDMMHRSLSLSQKNLTQSSKELEVQEIQGFKHLSTIKESKPRPYRTKDMMMQRSLSHNKMSKSPSELETEEVQGFKDLGFDFDNMSLNPIVTGIIPGLQSKKPDDWKEDKVRRPYLSEAWLVQRQAPLVPDWIDPGTVDMKKHLKYWARAVASNMRQEC